MEKNYICIHYKIIACLNVSIGDDNYRSVVSPAFEVLDENGNGAPVYDWPHINIDEAALKAGAISLHMTLTGDERIFSNDRVTIHYCLYQYPADEIKVFLWNSIDTMLPLCAAHISSNFPSSV